jgi:hypothetical protein
VRLRFALVSLLTWLVVAAPAALAQDRGRSPSGAELRRSYPLQTQSPAPTPTATPAPSPTAAPARSPTPAPARSPAPAQPEERSSGVRLATFGLLTALAFAAGFAIALRPLRRPPAEPPTAEEGPPAPERPALPPMTDRPWTAEIEWHETQGAPRFRVVARTAEGAGAVALLTTRPLHWPPVGSEGVQALTDAADALEATLLAAGWQPLPPGDAWYAKRFAWEPPQRAPSPDSEHTGRLGRLPTPADLPSIFH